jgi:hypothetical protein
VFGLFLFLFLFLFSDESSLPPLSKSNNINVIQMKFGIEIKCSKKKGIKWDRKWKVGTQHLWKENYEQPELNSISVIFVVNLSLHDEIFGKETYILSPYLFLLCAEGLSTQINKASKDYQIRGLTIHGRATPVSH